MMMKELNISFYKILGKRFNYSEIIKPFFYFIMYRNYYIKSITKKNYTMKKDNKHSDKMSDDEMRQYLESKDKMKQTKGDEPKSKKTVTPKPKNLGNINDGKEINLSQVKPSSIPTGYFLVNLKDLPSEGKYLPYGTRLSIRAAETKEIKHFSAMNEDDAMDVHERCNMILDETVSISCPTKQMHYYDLQDADRIYLILLIRDYTFKESENKLFVNMTCDKKTCKCGGGHKEELTSNLFDRKSIDDRVFKFYSDMDKCFEVDVPKYDMNNFQLHIPTIGVTTYLFDFMKELAHKRQNGEQVKPLDDDFMNILPYLISDWRIFLQSKDIASVIKKFELDYASWSLEKFSAVHKIVQLLTVSVELDFKAKCTNGSEVTGNFLGFLRDYGFKNIFLISNIFDEL